VYFEDRWLRCDVTDDRRLSEAIQHINPPTKLIEFDGSADAMLNLSPDSIDYYDGTCYASIDPVLSKKSRLPEAILGVFNEYVDYCRRHGSRYDAVDPLAQDFFRWLEVEHAELSRTFHEAEQLLHSARVSAPR
jgi:hypothetical protein